MTLNDYLPLQQVHLRLNNAVLTNPILIGFVVSMAFLCIDIREVYISMVHIQRARNTHMTINRKKDLKKCKQLLTCDM